MATAPRSSTRPSAPAPVKPPASEPAATFAEAAEVETEQSAGPIVERISIGSLVVKKTVYDDGDMEMTEVKTIKAGPDERFKSWRHAQPVD